MTMDFILIINSLLLGVGLAMDAFSVSIANGLNEPKMNRFKYYAIPSTFAVFQALMPLIGWLCIHTIAETFTSFQTFIPYIALALLGYIGGKMLYEGIKGESEDEDNKVCSKQDKCKLYGVCLNGTSLKPLCYKTLFVQGIATSIDALSVGFTIAEYDLLEAIICALIIALVTFIICLFGLIIGKKTGSKIGSKANILGGIILIAIGLEIFIKGIFF